MKHIRAKNQEIKIKHTESSRILEALKSRYITGGSELCKKHRPRAAPMAILTLVAQERGCLLPANQDNFEVD